MSTDAAALARPASSTSAPPRLAGLIGLPLLRVALVGLAALLTWAALAGADGPGPFPPSFGFAGATILPVNLICLWLVRSALHREGLRARDLIDFTWRRLGADLAWGLLWLVVLAVPFTLALIGSLIALHGLSVFEQFDTLFYDADAAPSVDRIVLAIVAITTVVTFAPLNAPTEELLYRGYSQGGLQRRWPVAWAILVPAAIFGLQHALFATTPDLMLAYVVAFLVWGIGSGIIVRWQRRLMPIIVAHFLVNFFTSAPALVIVFLPPEAFAG